MHLHHHPRAPASGPTHNYNDDDDFNWTYEPAPPEININNHPFLDPAYVHFVDINEPGPPRWPRTLEDNPIFKWIPERDNFLKEFIRLDGRGDQDLWEACRLCGGMANIRCRDCFGGEMFCQGCTVDLHAISPFHVIEKWNDTFFEPTTLKKIGLRIQLGHRTGDH